MNALAVVAGVVKLSRSTDVLSFITLMPRRLELAANTVTLVPLLSTLVVDNIAFAISQLDNLEGLTPRDAYCLSDGMSV